MGTRDRHGYVSVNGLRMYYEIQGAGPPLALFHGGYTTIESSFAALRPTLNERFTTIAVEQQAHGRTADIDRPLSFEQEVEDTAGALTSLGIERAHLFGYSDGGNVALGLAIKHPQRVERVATFGVNRSAKDLGQAFLDKMKKAAEAPNDEVANQFPKELKDAYRQVAPKPDDYATMVWKVSKQAVTLEGWSWQQLRAITAPTMVMTADADMIPLRHSVELFEALQHGRLAVLPGSDHSAPLARAEWVNSMLTDFFTAPLDSR